MDKSGRRHRFPRPFSTVTASILLILTLIIGGCTRQEPSSATATSTYTPTTTPVIGVDFVTVAPATAVFMVTSPTPLPSATPAPSPTPIVYEISAGDTLLALAWERGLALGDVLALNPGIVPEQLQIGQQIILPPAPTPLFSELVGTAIPVQLQVTQLQSYQTPVGSLWLLGEVENLGDLPAEQIQVQVTLLDDQGQSLASPQSWLALPIVPAGAVVPFALLVVEPPETFTFPEVVLSGGVTVNDLGSRYLMLEVSEPRVEKNEGGFLVKGVLHNVGDQSAHEFMLVASLYDAEGRMSGFAQQRLDTKLAPGENTSFTIDTAPPGGEPISVRILAQALRAEK